MKPVEIDPGADAELAAAMAEYDLKEDRLGRELLTEVEAMIADIGRWPWVGTRYGETPFRFRLVPRFPYVIYFREYDDTIWVAAIAHARQRPDYWRRRRQTK